jgi:hypothetical protein
MIAHAGVAIFLFGNRERDRVLINSTGVKTEFEIAKSKRLKLVPLGATGYASEALWQEVISKYDEYYSTRDKI